MGWWCVSEASVPASPPFRSRDQQQHRWQRARVRDSGHSVGTGSGQGEWWAIDLLRIEPPTDGFFRARSGILFANVEEFMVSLRWSGSLPLARERGEEWYRRMLGGLGEFFWQDCFWVPAFPRHRVRRYMWRMPGKMETGVPKQTGCRARFRDVWMIWIAMTMWTVPGTCVCRDDVCTLRTTACAKGGRPAIPPRAVVSRLVPVFGTRTAMSGSCVPYRDVTRRLTSAGPSTMTPDVPERAFAFPSSG